MLCYEYLDNNPVTDMVGLYYSARNVMITICDDNVGMIMLSNSITFVQMCYSYFFQNAFHAFIYAITHSHLRVPPEISSATFILLELTYKPKFAKYFMGVVVYLLINISPSNVFKKKCFCKENISKIVRPLLAALSVNGIIMPFKHVC